ncbi:MAG: hypothetical protein ACUVRV_09100 [Cyanobacteriota bacterium]
MTHPEVLILDESFGVLDTIPKQELEKELFHIWNEHCCTVLMITHGIDEVLFWADRLVLMTNRPAATIGQVISTSYFYSLRLSLLSGMDLGGSRILSLA